MTATLTIAPAPNSSVEQAEPAADQPQHMRALQRANRVRLARAALKRQVGAGQRAVAEVVLSCPWEARSMTVADLLTSQHRWGRTRCRKVLAPLGIAENKTIGSMTERQRRALAQRLARMGCECPEDVADAVPGSRPLQVSPA